MTELREEVARAIDEALKLDALSFDGTCYATTSGGICPQEGGWPAEVDGEFDILALADAAIAVMQSRWQLIETAPKDGTEVLITDGHTTVVAWWDDVFGWRDWGDIGWGGMRDAIPTHWQPLLEPPK